MLELAKIFWLFLLCMQLNQIETKANSIYSENFNSRRKRQAINQTTCSYGTVPNTSGCDSKPRKTTCFVELYNYLF